MIILLRFLALRCTQITFIYQDLSIIYQQTKVHIIADRSFLLPLYIKDL